MIYDILEAKIITAGLGVAGISLFRKFMPAECDVGVFTRSPLSGVAIDPDIEGWYNTSMQVIVRHFDPVLGQILSSAICGALIVEADEIYAATSERNRVCLKMFYPQTEPIVFPRLDGNGYEWSQHFKACFGSPPSWR